MAPAPARPRSRWTVAHEQTERPRPPRQSAYDAPLGALHTSQLSPARAHQIRLRSRRVAGTDHCLVARTRELAPDLARTTQLAALAVNYGCELLPPQYDTAGKWGRLDLSKALRAIRLPTVPVTAYLPRSAGTPLWNLVHGRQRSCLLAQHAPTSSR